MSQPAQEQPLGPEQVAGLARDQLADLAQAVEAQGTELGVLVGALLGLLERHQREALALALPGEAWAQQQADHRTLAGFAGPLALVAQHADRVRQRLEHLQAALARLPAAPLAPGQLPQAERLFPLEEERRLIAPHEPEADEPGMELFGWSR